MIYLQMSGRLGNQFFRYAAARALQIKYYPDEKIVINYQQKVNGDSSFYNMLRDYNVQDFEEDSAGSVLVHHTSLSITAGVGNSMLTKSIDQNYEEFCIFTLLVSFVNGICCACFMGLYQSFMKLWMGENLLLPFSLVVLLCVYFWIYEYIMMARACLKNILNCLF